VYPCIVTEIERIIITDQHLAAAGAAIGVLLHAVPLMPLHEDVAERQNLGLGFRAPVVSLAAFNPLLEQSLPGCRRVGVNTYLNFGATEVTPATILIYLMVFR